MRKTTRKRTEAASRTAPHINTEQLRRVTGEAAEAHAEPEDPPTTDAPPTPCALDAVRKDLRRLSRRILWVGIAACIIAPGVATFVAFAIARMTSR